MGWVVHESVAAACRPGRDRLCYGSGGELTDGISQSGSGGCEGLAPVSGYAGFGGRVEAATAIALVHARTRCRDHMLDTATYTPRDGRRELVGQAIKGRRDRIVLASKVYNKVGEGPNDRGAAATTSWRRSRLACAGSRPIISTSINCTAPTPRRRLEETLRALDDLRRQGKVRYFGTSMFPAWQLCTALWTSDRLGWRPSYRSSHATTCCTAVSRRRCCRSARVWDCRAAVQSPATRLADREVPPRPASRRRPGRAWRLGGTTPTTVSTWQSSTRSKPWKRSRRPSAPPSVNLALAWLVAQPGVTAPILGPRTLDQLHDNLGALEVEDHRRGLRHD